mmetsp:Transcript_69603/g.166062  ORF Transcript_69603/g.166062 Transcript_69603/m.166062 type:complete len:286 (+) Transcript_69603:1881-2738(+)
MEVRQHAPLQRPGVRHQPREEDTPELHLLVTQRVQPKEGVDPSADQCQAQREAHRITPGEGMQHLSEQQEDHRRGERQDQLHHQGLSSAAHLRVEHGVKEVGHQALEPLAAAQLQATVEDQDADAAHEARPHLVRHEAHVVQSVQLCDQDQQKANHDAQHPLRHQDVQEQLGAFDALQGQGFAHRRQICRVDEVHVGAGGKLREANKEKGGQRLAKQQRCQQRGDLTLQRGVGGRHDPHKAHGVGQQHGGAQHRRQQVLPHEARLLLLLLCFLINAGLEEVVLRG